MNTETLPQSEASREARLRRAARTQNLILRKSRTRDPWKPGWGTYQLVDFNNLLIAGDSQACNGYGLSLDDVERALNE